MVAPSGLECPEGNTTVGPTNASPAARRRRCGEIKGQKVDKDMSMDALEEQTAR